jgi:hypothetical protein
VASQASLVTVVFEIGDKKRPEDAYLNEYRKCLGESLHHSLVVRALTHKALCTIRNLRVPDSLPDSLPDSRGLLPAPTPRHVTISETWIVIKSVVVS